MQKRTTSLPLTAALSLLIAGSTAAVAELSDRLADCRLIESAVARLGCYDQLAEGQTSAVTNTPETTPGESSGLSARATPDPTPFPSVENSAEGRFGRSDAEVQRAAQMAVGDEDLDHIDATVAEVRESATGKAIVTLDNGQVWMQIDSKRVRLSNDDRITIRRASLGSFILYRDKNTMRVKRIS